MKLRRTLYLTAVFVLCVCFVLSSSALAAGGIVIGGATGPETGVGASAPSSHIPANPNAQSSGAGIVIGALTPSNAGEIKSGTSSGITIVEPPVEESRAPVVTKNPSAESVKAGESAIFIARADNAAYYTWYLLDAGGTVRYPAATVSEYLKGVTSAGANTERLVLSGLNEQLNGWMVECEFGNDYGTTMSAIASIEVLAPEATPTPEPTPTPTPAPTPTPTPAPTPSPAPLMPSSPSGTGGSNTNGTGVMGNQPGTVSSTASAPEEPSSGGYSSITGSSGSGISDSAAVNIAEKTQTSFFGDKTGAYILAAAAGLVIIGAVAVMALYMKGKISLGKFENIVDGSGSSDSDIFEGDEFYNPDDFKPEDRNRRI